jgi:uncharacterized UBP type Zn finger protein
MPDATLCEHVESVHPVSARTPAGCEECLKSGSDWVHLRLCMTCGHVGCCDSSPNQHATKHNRASDHPVIASYEPGEAWMYCYPDELFVETDSSIKSDRPL